jgi:hypothetical protein
VTLSGAVQVCGISNKPILGNAMSSSARGIWGLQMSSGVSVSPPATQTETAEEQEKQPQQRMRRNKGGQGRVRGMSKGEVDAVLLDKAFSAFADTMLQKKGRVRFHRINEAFRREFPDWASESRLSNQTLGRRVQIWYENKFGEPLGKSGRGAYIGLTMLNPNYVALDMRRIREVQAEINPERAKLMQAMGINTNSSTPSARTGTQGTQTTPRARVGKKGSSFAERRTGGRLGSTGRGKGSGRLGSTGGRGRIGSTGGGGRIGSAGGGGGKLVKSKKFVGTDTRGEALEPTIVLCVEAFANTLLVAEGEVMFREVFEAFKSQFPLLADEKYMSPNFLGAHLRDWCHPKPQTPNHKPQTPHPRPQTPHFKRSRGNSGI